MRNVLCLLLTIKTYMLPARVRILHTPNEIFLRNNFILIKLHSVTKLAPVNI